MATGESFSSQGICRNFPSPPLILPRIFSWLDFKRRRRVDEATTSSLSNIVNPHLTAVHSANPLARRHERVRLKTASLKSLDLCSKENSVPSWHGGFTRKARTPRHGKPVSPSKIAETIRNIPIPLVPEVGSDEISHEDNEEEHLLYRVPIFDPFVADLCASTNISNEAPAGGNDCNDQRVADSNGVESKI
uniref:Zinc finger protein CONSTANS-LIKE 6 n=1 Tax=Populus alba TaxID=43335 RepID=A0A4U5NPX0_POPAL|nr:zinc finger protein CONSTANS-LIKE 6 [Populus alba]